MSIVLNDLLENGLTPKKIYEICIPEGWHKDYLIRHLPREYERSVFIPDQFVRDFDGLNHFLERLPAQLDILIVDIGEISHLGYIKDYDAMLEGLKRFYEQIEAMSQLGTICVIFMNYFYYHRIFNGNPRPQAIQIHVYQSEVKPNWEAEITGPLELKGRKVQFNLFAEEMPFIQRF